jgi:branched-chain amino acid transport system substrate-binding protein
VGNDALRGIELAVSEFNEQGGITVKGKTYKFKVRSYDDEATPAKSVVGLERLKSLYEIPVVEMMFSGPSLAVVEKNVDLNVLWTGMSMHPDITKIGNPLVMRHNVPISFAAEEVGRTISKMGFKNIANLCSIDDWGRGWDTMVTEAMEAGGGNVIAHEFLDERSEVDFRPQLTKLKNLNPEALFIAAHDEVAAMITMQARELGLKIPLIHSEGFQQKAWEIVGQEYLDGCYYTVISGLPLTQADYPEGWSFSNENIEYMEKNPNVGRKAYFEAFNKKFPDDTLAAYGFISYENTWVVIEAMKHAQSVDDPYAIRKAMYEVMPPPKEKMTFGIIDYTKEGDGIAEVAVFGFRDGIWRLPEE